MLVSTKSMLPIAPANTYSRESQTYENEPVEEVLEQQPLGDIPSIIINDTDPKSPATYESEESSTETEMSSSHRSSNHHSSSSSSTKGKGHSTHTKHKSKNDDWSEITDPEERRRMQNRIAQRKFREKTKDAKERQDRDAENRTYAKQSYKTPNPEEMGTDGELSGLPWGSLSLKHVVSKGRATEDSRRGSRRDESHYGAHEQAGVVYDDRSAYYEDHQTTYYEPEEQPYYDYASGSGSGHGGSSH